MPMLYTCICIWMYISYNCSISTTFFHFVSLTIEMVSPAQFCWHDFSRHNPSHSPTKNQNSAHLTRVCNPPWSHSANFPFLFRLFNYRPIAAVQPTITPELIRHQLSGSSFFPSCWLFCFYAFPSPEAPPIKTKGKKTEAQMPTFFLTGS